MTLLRLTVCASLAFLAACQSAAEGAVPDPAAAAGRLHHEVHAARYATGGLRDAAPSIFGDNWRMDGYSDRAVYMKSDLDALSAGRRRPRPGARGAGQGHPQRSAAGRYLHHPRRDPDAVRHRPAGDRRGRARLPRPRHALPQWARYQGSTFEAQVDVTIGSCTATYDVQALTPTQTGGPASSTPTAIPSPIRRTGARWARASTPTTRWPAPRRTGWSPTSPAIPTSASASSPSPSPGSSRSAHGRERSAGRAPCGRRAHPPPDRSRSWWAGAGHAPVRSIPPSRGSVSPTSSWWWGFPTRWSATI